MLNLNLNTVGAGAGKNDSNFDPRLFFTMLEDFYTASLLANTRLDVVVSGSTIYNEPRYFSTTLTSSATPSTQQEFIVVAQTTYLIERDSEVSCSFQGFPKWDPVQFGDPSLFSNVTMSLEIPTIGFSTSSYGTGSLLTHEFIAQEKGIYFVDAKVIFNDYYNSTINEHFNQSGSYTNLLQVTSSGTGFFVEDQYVVTGSGLLNKVSTKPSGSIVAKLIPTGSWGIINAVGLTPNFSHSLVTMSLETPFYGYQHSFNTASILTANFGSPNYYIADNGVADISASINTRNPYIPIEWMIVGGGAAQQDISGNVIGGAGGWIKSGRFNVDASNQTTISGIAGPKGVITGNTNPSVGGITYFYYTDTSGNSITQSTTPAEQETVASPFCPTDIFGAFQWVDGGYYGQAGSVNQACPTLTSSLLPNNSGNGGGRVSGSVPATYFNGNGTVAIRYYNPYGSYTASLTGSNIVTSVSGGYVYHYITNTGSLSQINFYLSNQEYSTPIETLPTSSTIDLDWLLVGGGAAGGSGVGGGGGAGEVISGSTTIPFTSLFDLSIEIGRGANSLTSSAGYPGLPSYLSGNIYSKAYGGGGGNGVAGGAAQLVSQPWLRASGGGNRGAGILNNYQIEDGFPGGTGSADVGVPERRNCGGGGGASQAGHNGRDPQIGLIPPGGYGGSGSIWLDGNYYAGGGGGATSQNTIEYIALGGIGGGGNGGFTNFSSGSGTGNIAPISGSPNTGGGGGGGHRDGYGAAGGSGVAVFRLLTSAYNFLTASNHIITGSNVDTYTSSSYTFIRAKNDSNLTIFNSIN
jgi:hypothetical protein